MPRDPPEAARTALAARALAGRTLEQRLALRFPALAAAALRIVARLPPRSRLRRAFIPRLARGSLEAYNRRDLDVIVIGWRPDAEYRPDRAWVQAGLVEPSYRGPEGYRTYVATVDEVWGGENYLTPLEVIDLGDRVVTLARGRMRAQASGVPLTEDYALVSTFAGGGWFATHEEYYDHAAALRAVGLPV
jgi:ketosteroid isomerase-like protein